MKIIKILLVLFLSISLIGCRMEDQNEAFLQFINEYIIEEISSDYTTMHTYFENPENYGIDVSKVEVSLGERYSEQSFKNNQDKLKELESKFKEFNRNSLDDDNKKMYDDFKINLNQSIELSKDEYKYLGTAFEADSGIHVNLPMLLNDWVLRNEEDVKDLILLVKDVEPYINSLLDYTKEQASAGYLMIDIDSVCEYCDNIVSMGKNNSTLTSMKESIDKLSLNNSEEYKKQLEDVFISSFITAYQNISKTLKDLKSEKNNSEGLAKLTNGKEYYEDLMRAKIGSNKSVDDVKVMLEDALNEYLLGMQRVYFHHPEVIDEVDNLKTSYSNYEDIMKDLEKAYKNDFPEVSDLEYDISPVSDEIASQGIGAYFMIPAIDSTTHKQIRVNTKSNTRDITSIDTYTTTAHEGIPGHMYMYAYVYENTDQLYYKIEDSIAFTEGYATYVQLYSMKYLEGIDENALELLKYNEMYTYCVIALADIGIHYDGWSLEEFSDFFDEKGFSANSSILEKQYKQLQSNPATFLPYYVGFVEIDNLKTKAEEALGDKFNDKDFHQALIKNGARNFDVVEEQINEYISENK